MEKQVTVTLSADQLFEVRIAILKAIAGCDRDAKACDELAARKCEDGTPVFPDAPKHAEEWRKTKRILESALGKMFDERDTRAVERSAQ
jgi:hypothetical protein